MEKNTPPPHLDVTPAHIPWLAGGVVDVLGLDLERVEKGARRSIHNVF